ncbi:hypothetical protein LRR81_01360 [Metabacillus sp. GX 13764]|uniref:hypothetical protein n=1 Tax=Metabacillus kandeliae TaxID=2900151 RepID=UPI001E63E1A5|nr:hypothetical protein [Metabacillus kandeliae]MCD7032858.1 hypothetical protein [Metabacillus kandeliae]
MKNFVKMPMAMLAYGTNWYAEDDEVVLYAHLVLERQYKRPTSIQTNIELIHSIVQFDKSNPSRGKARVKKALIALAEKRYINLSSNKDEISNSSLLTIDFYLTKDNLSVVTTDNHKTVFSGYAELNYEEYLLAKYAGRYIKIIMHTKYRENINYKITISEWANVLQISERTVLRDKENWNAFVTETKGIKSFTEGVGYRQEASTYMNGAQETSKTFETTEESFKSKIIMKNKISECKDRRFLNNPNLFENRSKLSYYDIYLWKTTDCEVAKKVGDQRIKSICKSDGGKAMISDFIRKADARIMNDEKRKEEIKVRDSVNIAHFEEFGYPTDDNYKYVRREDNDTIISEFLEDETPTVPKSWIEEIMEEASTYEHEESWVD